MFALAFSIALAVPSAGHSFRSVTAFCHPPGAIRAASGAELALACPVELVAVRRDGSAGQRQPVDINLNRTQSHFCLEYSM